MFKTKRICALLLCVLILCSSLALSACKGDKPGTTGDTGVELGENEALYKVSVVDGLGTPYTEKVIVKFMQGETQVAMATINDKGVAEKVLEKGDYTVQISSTVSGSDCWYDTDGAVLTADTHELEVVMAFEASGDGQKLSATSPTAGTVKDYTAYQANVGSTYVKLDTADRTYVLFVPTEAGEYEVSVSGGSADIGSYGSPHYVQSFSTEEVVDNKFTVTIRPGMIGTGSTGTTTIVIGLDSKDGAEDAILNIKRVGDPAWSIEDEPWVNYQPKEEVKPYTLPEGTKLKEFDLKAKTDAVKLVLNEKDGCYHLNTAEGPMVFVQLDAAVYGISMKAMVGEIIYQDGVLMQSGTAPFRYSVNNGQDDFMKEDYTDAMRQYVTNRDKKSGVYPLDSDLYYMLNKGIDFAGWCKQDSSNYLFRDVEDINNEICWMFLLCYADGDIPVPDHTDTPDVPDHTDTPNQPVQPDDKPNNTQKPDNGGNSSNNEKPVTKPVDDNKDAPELVVSLVGPDQGILQFTAEIKANHIHYYEIPRVSDTTLRINSGDAYVIYDGVTYKPKNGVVTIRGLICDNYNPVSLAICNQGTKDAKFTVQFVYPEGHIMNPITLKTGAVTTDMPANNEVGMYYTFNPSKNGTLTITLDSIVGKAQCDITITNASEHSKTVSLIENSADGKTITMDVGKGDDITVIISVLPNENFRYPAAKINTTVTLK